MPIKRRASKSQYRGSFPEFCEGQLIEGPDTLLRGVGYLGLVDSKPSCLADCLPGEAETILAAMAEDWTRHGLRLMAVHDDPAAIWAFRQFGQPKGQSDD